MSSLGELILKIKEHKILYNKSDQKDERKLKEAWRVVAEECCLESAIKAENLWQNLLDEYLNFLRDGGDFKLAKDLQFMQEFILKECDDSSESELDDCEVERVCTDEVFSDDDYETMVEDHLNEQDVDTKTLKRTTTEPVIVDSDCNTTKRSRPQNASDEIPLPSGNFNNLSSVELIFLGYAKMLQKMPPALQLQTKRKIADIMDEAEMKMLEEK